jgi:2-methylisocitrate lyase-like PEP mutase family enzyme
VRAASEARGSSEVVLIARSDARADEGLDRAIERVSSYHDAGADIVFIDALQSESEIVAFGEALPDAPKVINWVEGGKTPLLHPERLRELNFRLVFCSLAALLAATGAIQERLATLRDIAAPQPVGQVQFDKFNELIGMPDIEDLETRFG